MKKGKLIVFYGVNNLGKTTQAELLEKELIKKEIKILRLKYPLYRLTPSGAYLNDYLRGGNILKFSARESQILNALDRHQFQEQLIQYLNEGKTVIAEDYFGTGIAWGIRNGVDKDFLININSKLIKPDLAILFDGKRFVSGKEKGHRHEEDDELTKKVRQVHLDLAKEFDWKIINANQSIEDVYKDIFKIVKSFIIILK